MVFRQKILAITIIALAMLTACAQDPTGAAVVETEETSEAIVEETAMEVETDEMNEHERSDVQVESAPVEIPEASEDAITFEMTGENFKFVMDGQDNPEIKVKVGDKVRIEFTSTQGFHDWVVDEFSAATAQVRPDDGMTAVEFIADQAGTFEYYCSVGSHRVNGMKGNLIVE